MDCALDLSRLGSHQHDDNEHSCDSHRCHAFEQAQAFEKAQEFAKAYESYQMIIDNYPKSSIRYKALFMAGYIQLEQLKDSKKALGLFDTLLKEYPSCDLADDAKVIRDAAASGKDLMTVFQDSLKGK